MKFILQRSRMIDMNKDTRVAVSSVHICPDCEMKTGIFGLLLAPVGTFSIFRMTSKPSMTRPVDDHFSIIHVIRPEFKRHCSEDWVGL